MHGFRWAFGGGAAFVFGALVVMLALLRREHVARIHVEAAQPVVANV